MPIASQRSWVAVAKDTIDTYLTAGVSAGATSIPVATNVVPASSTIFFLDGPNSESRAVTAGGGTTTLTVAATTNAHGVNCPIYAQLTAGLGPVTWIPITPGGVDYTDSYAMIPDTGIRGSNVENYGVTQAAGMSTISLAGELIPDVFGYLLGGMFGAVDFSGGSPNSHTFACMNTAASQGQPTPFIVYIYDGYNTRAFAGAKVSELTIKIDPGANIQWTAKLTAFPSIIVYAPGAQPAATYSALSPQAAWQITPTIATVAYPTLLSCDFTFKRKAIDAINTADSTQAPYRIWVDALTATGNANFVMEDEVILLNFLNNSQPATTWAFTNGAGASQTALTVQGTKTAFLTGWNPKITGGKGYVELGGPIEFESNTTDSNTAGGGYSPCKVILKNAVATGTYQ